MAPPHSAFCDESDLILSDESAGALPGSSASWRELYSERLDAGLLKTEVLDLPVRGQPFESSSEHYDMSGLGRIYRRFGAPPEVIIAKSGLGLALAWNDYQRSAVVVTRLSRSGQFLDERIHTVDAMGPSLDTQGLLYRSADYERLLVNDGISRLAGFLPLSNGSYALAIARRDDPGYPDGSLQLGIYDKQGLQLGLQRNALYTEQSEPRLESMSWRRFRPMAASSCRLATGGGVIGMHFGHCMQWPDGSVHQGGGTRYFSMLKDGSLRRSRSIPAETWLGSHALDQRSVFDSRDSTFVHAVLCAGFPRAIFLTKSVDYGRCPLLFIPGDPGSDVGVEMGGLVVTQSGYALSFCTQRRTKGGREFGVVFIRRDAKVPERVVWLGHTDGGVVAVNPKLVRIGQGLLLAAWRVCDPLEREAASFVCILDEAGRLVVPPRTLSSVSWHRPDDFAVDMNDRAVWATGAGRRNLRLWRLSFQPKFGRATPKIA